MRRKKDDKRVLRRGNGQNDKRSRRTPHIGFNNRINGPNINNNVKKQNKRSRKTVLLVILVLIAFIVGAGAGILMSFDDGTVEKKNETHYENVTVEMTTNLNESNEIIFDESDHVDFNENRSSEILGADKNPYYNGTVEENY